MSAAHPKALFDFRSTGTSCRFGTRSLDPEADLDDVDIWSAYGNTFQQAQLDFGPDASGAPLLPPENSRSWQAGIKADGFEGRLSAELGAFWVEFGNQAQQVEVNGQPSLQPGGVQRYKGLDFDLSGRLTPALSAHANFTWSDARYGEFTSTIDGVTMQFAGNHLILAPRTQAAFGVIYGGRRGLLASVTANLIGDRFLDSANTVRVGAGATLDASLGWRFQRFTVDLVADNVGDRRDPVAQSELGEGQFYSRPARRVFGSLIIGL